MNNKGKCKFKEENPIKKDYNGSGDYCYLFQTGCIGEENCEYYEEKEN